MPSADSLPAEAPTSEPQAQDPPPEQPTAPTAGPRATAFLTLYDKTLSTTLRTISYNNFAACFPSIAANAPEALKHMHKRMIERLEGFAKKNFNLILKERHVIENLNALEELIAEAQRRKARAVAGETPPAPPHTLPAHTILQAHLSPHLASTQSQLNARLQTVQSQNAALAATVQAQNREIESLLAGLEGSVRDLEGAGGALGSEEGVGGTLRQVLSEVDAEMEGL